MPISWRLTGSSGLAIDEKPIGRDASRNDQLPQPPRRFGEHLFSLRIEGIAREENAGDLGGNEPLHDDGHRGAVRREPFLRAIRLRPGRIPTTGNSVDRGQELLLSLHAENCFLLTGKAVLGAVFGRCRRPDGDHPGSESMVGGEQFRFLVRMSIGDAIAVRQNPSGNRQPARSISPRFNPLPPTRVRSPGSISVKGMMGIASVAVDETGHLWRIELSGKTDILNHRDTEATEKSIAASTVVQ